VKAVEVSNLWWRYAGGRGWVLRDVSFDVEEREIVGVIGPSGAGKTTLCLCLTGVIPHSVRGELRGVVRVFGVNTLDAGVARLSEMVGAVFQNPDSQFVTLRVLDEVAFPLENFGVERGEMVRRVEEALLATDTWAIRHKPPTELSGGQKQRVAIATMLARRPSLLVLDEPTSDLDPEGRKMVFETFSTLREEYKVTLVIVSHDTEELAKHADRLLLLNGGRVEEYAEARAVLSKVDKLRSVGVYPPQVTELAGRVFRQLNAGNSAYPLTVEECLEAMRDLRGLLRVEPREEPLAGDAEAAIEFRDVHFTYPDGTVALRGVDLKVRKGEFLGLIGRNGSGKSTMAKLATGLYKPTRGEVLVAGRDTRAVKVSDLATTVGYVFQNPDHQLFCTTVFDEVAFSLRSLGFSDEYVEERVGEVLRSVGLEGLEDTPPYFLSMGERQRLAVAAVLATDPEIVVVDEPTTGQDAARAREIMGLLRRLNEGGKTVVVITHDMRLVAEYCSRVAVLSMGRVVREGKPRDVLSDYEAMSLAGIEPPQIVRFSKTFFGVPALRVEEVVVK